MKTFCREGDNIITADQTYAVYEWLASFAGIQCRLTPLKDSSFDDEAILNSIDERSKVIFICNPNNPTGTYWSEAKMRAFLDKVAGDHIVVIDEAYWDFVENDDFPIGTSLIKDYPNVIVFRTFSKMYGMAGLRIGYLAGDVGVVDMIRNTTVSYSVNYIAQAAARAALADKEHVSRTREMVKKGKEYLIPELERLGLPYLTGEGNFVMIKLPMSDSFAYRKLMQKGIMVRSMTSFRFPNYIRVTMDGVDVLGQFVGALENILPD
jgi:histidinol-phosphate aminotransferase